MLRCGLASDGVYICPPCYQRGGSLLHCPSTLTGQSRRFISVALSLESPPPDVIRHPCPVKPGLSSSGTFRPASRDHLSYLHLVFYIHQNNQSIETIIQILSYCFCFVNIFPPKTGALICLSVFSYRSKHPLPINSRIRELFGMSSAGIGRK